MAPETGSPAVTLQVIACGLPRTGTTTIGRALSILLEGPVLDGIADTFLHGTLRQQQDLHKLTETKHGDPALKPLLATILASHPDIVATTDAPFPEYVAELHELYPHLQFICTTRDFDKWYKSFSNIHWTYSKLAPYARLWGRLYRCIECIESSYANIWRRAGSTRKLLAGPMPDEAEMKDWYDRHMAKVHEVIPTDKLLLYRVQEGWGPLCAFLGRDVPVDGAGNELPFPHEFSSQDMDEWREGLLRTFRLQTALIVGGIVVGGVLLARWALPR